VIWRVPLTVTLSLVPLIIATGTSSFDENTNEATQDALAYYELQGSDFTFRWTAVGATTSLECDLYEACTWIDQKGPSCQNEFLVELQFYDQNEEYVDDTVAVLPSNGKSELNAVEVGTNRDIEFDSLLLISVECSLGRPTGLAGDVEVGH
jgi:hypothetical protein